MLGVISVAILAFAVALICWPHRFRVEARTAELVGGVLLVFGLVLIGVGLSTTYR